MMRGFSACVLVFALMGCRNSGDSVLSGLSGTLKPEGFLVVKDISPDPAKSGSFLVTCASSAGDKKSSVTQAEIEANKVCLPNLSAAAPKPAAGGTDEEQPAGSSPASAYTAKLVRPSPLKSRPNMMIEGNTQLYKIGIDYCALPGEVSASNICKSSEKELKITGVKILGCDLTTGYLFSEHFTVTPAVSACR